MKEIILKHLKLFWAISFVILMITFILAIDKLPTHCAVQFDLKGNVTMWWAKDNFILIFGAIIIGVNGFFAILASPLVQRIPICLITLPFKKRWLKLKLGEELYCERVREIVSFPPIFANTVLFLSIDAIMYGNGVFRVFTFSPNTAGIIMGITMVIMLGGMIYYSIPPKDEE